MVSYTLKGVKGGGQRIQKTKPVCTPIALQGYLILNKETKDPVLRKHLWFLLAARRLVTRIKTGKKGQGLNSS